MRFYYNADLNICAEEDWVVDYILCHEDVACDEFAKGLIRGRDFILDNLRSRREYCGWFDCEVSNTIAEKMEGSSLDNY